MKERVDPLSDAIFSIVMTLLVLRIHVPHIDTDMVSNLALFEDLLHLIPDFGIYFFSFGVLGSYWISHNIILGVFAKNMDRVLVMINFGFLCIASLVPFSAELLSQNFSARTGIIVYSLNIFLLTAFLATLRLYTLYSKNIENPDIIKLQYTQADRLYANTRLLISLGSTVMAVICSFVFTPLSFVFLTIPVVYGLIPGLLSKTLKIFGVKERSNLKVH